MRPATGLPVALIALLALVACSPTEAPARCAPGIQVACACPGGAQGAQACNASGDGYGACACPDGAVAGDVTSPLDVSPDRAEVDAGAGSDVGDVVGTDSAGAEDADAGSRCAACPEVPGAVATCEAGACGWTCRPGRIDCDRNTENGCEIDGAADLRNCGACGTGCPTAPGMVATCSAGVCGTGPLVCSGGLANCDGDVANGCEVNLSTGTPATTGIVNHCGACGRTCSFANAAAQCLAGQCVMGACNPGFADCDTDPANGCETNTQFSTLHCGRCGNQCSYPNAIQGCRAPGTCFMAGCNRGWCDRDRNPANGCESPGPC